MNTQCIYQKLLYICIYLIYINKYIEVEKEVARKLENDIYTCINYLIHI